MGILICAHAPGRTTGFISFSALLGSDSVVSVRYPLGRRDHSVVGTSTFGGYGSNTFFVGATHNNMISRFTLCRTLRDNGLSNTTISILGDRPVTGSYPLVGTGGVVVAPRAT